MTVTGKWAHPELCSQRQSFAITLLGLSEMGGLAPQSDLTKETQRMRFFPALAILTRSSEGALREPGGFVGTSRQEVNLTEQDEHAYLSRPEFRDERHLARPFQQRIGLARASGLRVRVGQKTGRLKGHEVELSRLALRKATLERFYGSGEVAAGHEHAADAHARLGDRPWALDALGDRQPFFADPDSFDEVAQLGEAPPKPAAGDEGGGRGAAEALADEVALQRPDVVREERDGLSISPQIVGDDPEMELRPGFQIDGTKLVCDAQGVLEALDRGVVLADRSEAIADARGDEPEASLIAERLCRGFGLAKDLETSTGFHPQKESEVQIESEIDTTLDRLVGLRKMPESDQRLLERRGGLPVGRARGRLATGLMEIDDRFVPHFTAERMVGEALDFLFEPSGREPLDRVNDPSVEIAPPVGEQAPVGHLVSQRVFEGVDEFREQARLVEELGALQACEPGPELLVRAFADGLEQCRRDVRSDCGRCLEQALVLWRQPIDASRQDGLDREGQLDRLGRAGEAILPALPDQHARLDQRTNALFKEERVALSAIGEQLLELIEPAILAHECPQKLAGALRRQRVDPELPVVGLASPAVSKFRPIVHAEEQASRRQSFDHGIENRLGFVVDPVQILEDHQQRLRLAFSQEHPLDRAERALPAMSRVEPEKWIVGRQGIEQRQRGGDRVLQRPIQRQQRAGDLGPDGTGVVSSLNSAIGTKQLDHRQIRCRLSVGSGCAFEHEPAMRPMRTNELMKEPRLAHPGLADHRDDLTPARASLLLSLAKLLELGVASDEAREPASRGNL